MFWNIQGGKVVEKRVEIEQHLGRANVGSSGLITPNSQSSTDKQYAQTSLEALPPELKREAMNKQVWYFLRAIPNSTIKEISKGLEMEIQTVCWRVHDLRDENSIEESGTKIFEGKRMKTWRIQDTIKGVRNE